MIEIFFNFSAVTLEEAIEKLQISESPYLVEFFDRLIFELIKNTRIMWNANVSHNDLHGKLI